MLRVTRDDTTGIRVTEELAICEANTHAQSMGLVVGDVITHVNSARVKDRSTFEAEMEGRKTFTLTLVNKGRRGAQCPSLDSPLLCA